VDDICAAIVLSEAVVVRSRVEDEGVLTFEPVGKRNDRLRLGVDDHEAYAFGHLPDNLSNQLAGISVLHGIEYELLLQETTSGVIIGYGKASTGETTILRRDIEQGQRGRSIPYLLGKDDPDRLWGGDL
jgi:hypothetical protein